MLDCLSNSRELQLLHESQSVTLLIADFQSESHQRETAFKTFLLKQDIGCRVFLMIVLGYLLSTISNVSKVQSLPECLAFKETSLLRQFIAFIQS